MKKDSFARLDISRFDNTQNMWMDGVPLKERTRMTPDEIKKISQLDVRKSILAILKEWGMISVAMIFAVYFDTWLSYLLAIIFIGFRQNALAILMHEAAHYRLFKSKWINDIVSNWLLGMPLFIKTERYRHYHILHHRHLGTSDDPERSPGSKIPTFQAGQSKSRLFLVLACNLIGLTSLLPGLLIYYNTSWIVNWKVLEYPEKWKRVYKKLEWLLYFVALGSLLYFTNGWKIYVLLWLIPWATVFMLMVRIRSLVDHEGVPNTNLYNASRTILMRARDLPWLFSPYHVHYHLEHHLWPSVPWYNLPRLQTYLLQEEANFRNHGHFTNGFLSLNKGIVSELTRSNTG